MPVVEGDMPLVLRVGREPPASDPAEGALSAAQVDGNWAMLKAAILVLAAEKLDASAATELTGPEEPESGDFIVIIKDGIPYYALVDDLIGGGDMANPMTTLGDMIVGGASGVPERVGVSTNGHVWTMVAGVPAWAAPGTLSPGDPVVITHDGAGEDPTVGDTLEAEFAAGWSGDVQWVRDDANISGATSPTYTLVEADAETVVDADISNLVFRAPGFAVSAPPPPPAGLSIVQAPTPVSVGGANSITQTFTAIGAANAVAFGVIYPTSAGAPTSVVDNLANSLGTPVYEEAGVDFTARFYTRANINDAITSITATWAGDVTAWCGLVEVAGAGSSLVVDAFNQAFQSTNTAWTFPFTSTVDDVLFMALAQPTGSATPTGVSPVTAYSLEGGWAYFAQGLFPTAGSNTAQFDLSTGRNGDKYWCVFKPGP